MLLKILTTVFVVLVLIFIAVTCILPCIKCMIERMVTNTFTYYVSKGGPTERHRRLCLNDVYIENAFASDVILKNERQAFKMSNKEC